MLIKNGKFFVPPPEDDINFKDLFLRLAAAGAGRPVDSTGVPLGSWTPELLANAITNIETNRDGIDLRTVQLWFQDNSKGISKDNIRWLARVFGCDDPTATRQWQEKLTLAQSKLAAERRQNRRGSAGEASTNVSESGPSQMAGETTETALDRGEPKPIRGISLARRSEAVFSRASPLDLPVSVFAGSVVLGFFAYLTGLHSVTYELADGLMKQVGFIWAPNWTFLFMVFLPLFLTFVVDIIAYWKGGRRQMLLAEEGQAKSEDPWVRLIENSTYTFWAVFLVCLLLAGLAQWYGRRLVPLLRGEPGADPLDWGSISIDHPELVSVPTDIAFTALAYLYMCICFYLFFVGLILLYTVVYDLANIGRSSKTRLDPTFQRNFHGASLTVLRAIYRCVVSGILIAICMRLQSAYLRTSSETIVAWLRRDFLSTLLRDNSVDSAVTVSSLTHYASLLIVISVLVVFTYGALRLGVGSRFYGTVIAMAVSVGIITTSYLSIGGFHGFSILLSFGVLVAIYGLFDPGYEAWRAKKLMDNHDVS